jgi:hypothetical protein
LTVAQDDNFLARWSRRKTEARAKPAEAPAAAPAVAAPVVSAPAPVPAGADAAPAEPAPLPPVESLTPESDFAPFMKPEVDGETRSKALKALFADPHFNTMDMMDVYVDDYSKPDPLPAGWLEKLEQLSHLGDRAGRDREEAERRAAEEAAARAGETEAAKAAAEGADPAPAAPAGPEAPAPAPEGAIPPPEGGESGT